MTTRFARGLVVGKFCPLHRGHQHLIDAALARCDALLVVSYAKPERARCPPEARERWLALLCPGVERLVIDDRRLADACRARGVDPRRLPPDDAPDDVHRDFVAWLCTDLLRTTVNAVFTSEGYGDGFALRLGRRLARPVAHVCVDLERRAVPVSGSAVRAAPHAHRHLLDLRVYADLVGRVALLGGESSGKTTLARALADALDTRWVPEYGRQLWQERDGDLRPDDMLAIARTQVADEDRIAQDARDWLFCDTTPLTTLFYGLEAFGRVDPELEDLATRRYDLTLLCESDFTFQQDGTRRGSDFSAAQHRWYVAELERRGIAYTRVGGTIAERVQAVRRLLERSGVAAPPQTHQGPVGP